MAELTDAEFEAAQARGREKLRAEPRAVAALYDRETGRVVVELANGCTHILAQLRSRRFRAPGAAPVDGARTD